METLIDLAGTQGLSLAELESLVPRLRRPVFRLLLAELADRDLAETLTQECFLRACRARHRFRGEGSVDGWILRIAANLARDHRKNRGQSFWRRLLRLDAEPAEQEVTATPLAAGPDPEQWVLQREAVGRVEERMRRLPDRQRQVFHLRYLEDMPLEDIADVLGIAVGSVKSHLARAVAAVREELRS